MLLRWPRRTRILSWVLVAAAWPMLEPACWASSPQRRALLIGIDSYSAGGEVPRSGDAGQERSAGSQQGRTKWPNLKGAVNDVVAFEQMLRARFGFREEGILVLKNGSATRQAILQAIGSHLLQPAAKGDQILFYFSGHGSQVVNSKSHEPDGLDESIVPADSVSGAPDIRDKELRALFNRILDRGARLTVILDSCHSGSGVRGLPPDARLKGLAIDRRDAADGSPAGPRPESRGALAFSAAQDFGKAWESYDEEGRSHGAFSLALLRALRFAGAQEPAERLFLRTRALLQADGTYQEPVLAGNELARWAPFLKGPTDHREGKVVVAVERVGEKGEVVLQGGWANGLAVGSRLRAYASGEVETRLEITSLTGLGRSVARVVPPPHLEKAIQIEPGKLFEVVGWAAPPGPPLRVWLPQKEIASELNQLVSDLKPSGLTLVPDPTEDTPTHVLRWAGDKWQLLGSNQDPEHFGPAPTAAALLAKLPQSGSKLFIQVPVPIELAAKIRIGPDTEHTIVEAVSDPAAADFVLAGRLKDGKVEFAWVRPGATMQDRRSTGIPVRSDWHPWPTDEQTAIKLEQAVLRLAKIHAWHALQSPPPNEFPYTLELKEESGRPLTDGTLYAGRSYGLSLRARLPAPPADFKSRYVYVFVIDELGNSVLLYPTDGSVENRLPVLKEGSQLGGELPREIPLGEHPSFEVVEPLGIDTYFLLTSLEPIPNPWVLESSGVRKRGPEGSTALEQLLSQTGSTMRAARRIYTSVTWSIEKQAFESIQ